MPAMTRGGTRGQTVTISSGQTKSSAINVKDSALYGLSIPAAFTGTSISFEGSDASNGTFQPLYGDDNVLVTLTVAVSRNYKLPYEKICMWPWLKIVSNASEAGTRSMILVEKA